MADWKKIKTEYITSELSYASLAKKHGLSTSRVTTIGCKEGWRKEREEYRRKAVAKALNSVSSQQAARAARIANAGDKLLDRVVQLLESDAEALMDTGIMRDVSVVLKNLKDLQMIRSDLDLKEQEARIDKLRKEAEAGSADKEPVRVIIEGDLAEYTS